MLKLTGTSPLTRSCALAVNVATAPAGLVASSSRSEGRVSRGGVVSTTVTLKVAVAVFPAASVAMAITTVVPRGKVLPERGVSVTGSVPSLLSVALAANVATAPSEPAASTVISPGTVITGGVTSLTVYVALVTVLSSKPLAKAIACNVVVPQSARTGPV